MHETEKERLERLHKERIQHLKYALAKRDRLAKELAETDAYITQESRKYWSFLGYTVIPRIQRLREALGV